MNGRVARWVSVTDRSFADRRVDVSGWVDRERERIPVWHTHGQDKWPEALELARHEVCEACMWCVLSSKSHVASLSHCRRRRSESPVQLHHRHRVTHA